MATFNAFRATIEGRKYVGDEHGNVSEVYAADQFGEQLPRLCNVDETREILRRVRNMRAANGRKTRESALRSCGLVKVRGALGGTYWE